MGDYVLYKDVKEGSGEIPIRGHMVQVAYTMSLANGKRISSEDAITETHASSEAKDPRRRRKGVSRH